MCTCHNDIDRSIAYNLGKTHRKSVWVGLVEVGCFNVGAHNVFFLGDLCHTVKAKDHLIENRFPFFPFLYYLKISVLLRVGGKGVETACFMSFRHRKCSFIFEYLLW